MEQMSKEEILNHVSEIAKEMAYRDFKRMREELDRKFKKPRKRPLEKKVVRLAYYRHIKAFYQSVIERENLQHKDSPEYFRAFCKFRVNWLRRKGRKDAISKQAEMLKKTTVRESFTLILIPLNAGL